VPKITQALEAVGKKVYSVLKKVFHVIKNWVVKGVKAAELLEQVIVEATILDKPTMERYFPAPYVNKNYQNPNAGVMYKHNDELLGYSQLAIALNLEAYYPQPKAGKSEGGVNVDLGLPVSSLINPLAKSPNKPADFCTSADPKHPVNYDAVWARRTLGNYFAKATSYAFNAQIYVWERSDEVLVTLAVRGSEMPKTDLEVLLSTKGIAGIPNLIKRLWGDWVGSDFSEQTTPDKICNKKGTMLQAGYANAWMANREPTLAAFKAQLQAAKDKFKDKKVKALVTGYSLSAAIGQLIAYDLSCNNFFSGPLTEVIHVGLITMGTPAFTFDSRTKDTYTSTVPLSKRVQLEDCGHATMAGSKFIACDMVTSSVKVLHYTTIQPSEDIQVVIKDGSCLGIPNMGMCHLLDGYIQGAQKVPAMNKNVCKPANYPTHDNSFPV
jgi:hypothetical protein